MVGLCIYGLATSTASDENIADTFNRNGTERVAVSTWPAEDGDACVLYVMPRNRIGRTIQIGSIDMPLNVDASAGIDLSTGIDCRSPIYWSGDGQRMYNPTFEVGYDFNKGRVIYKSEASTMRAVLKSTGIYRGELSQFRKPAWLEYLLRHSNVKVERL